MAGSWLWPGPVSKQTSYWYLERHTHLAPLLRTAHHKIPPPAGSPVFGTRKGWSALRAPVCKAVHSRSRTVVRLLALRHGHSGRSCEACACSTRAAWPDSSRVEFHLASDGSSRRRPRRRQDQQGSKPVRMTDCPTGAQYRRLPSRSASLRPLFASGVAGLLPPGLTMAVDSAQNIAADRLHMLF